MDPLKLDSSTELEVRKESDYCAFLSNLDEVLTSKDVGEEILVITTTSIFL